jgi:hypothetical protein
MGLKMTILALHPLSSFSAVIAFYFQMIGTAEFPVASFH